MEVWKESDSQVSKFCPKFLEEKHSLLSNHVHEITSNNFHTENIRTLKPKVTCHISLMFLSQHGPSKTLTLVLLIRSLSSKWVLFMPLWFRCSGFHVTPSLSCSFSHESQFCYLLSASKMEEACEGRNVPSESFQFCRRAGRFVPKYNWGNDVTVRERCRKILIDE